MLKQILEDMYIDPELLEMLTDDDKELLFRKMREEQVKRWKLCESKLEMQERRCPPKRTTRKVNFMMGANKEPWVWVMGEGPGDLPYEELVKKREKEQLEKIRRQEEEDRKKAEELALLESKAFLVDDPTLNSNNNNYESIDEGILPSEDRDTLSPLPSSPSPTNKRLSIEEIEVLQKQRVEELYVSFKETRLRARKRSEQVGQTVEQMWKDQEKKSKSFMLKKKESYIKARERLKSDGHLPELLLEKLPEKQKTVIHERMTVRRRTLSSSMSAGSLPRYQFAPKHLPRVKDITSDLSGTRPSSRAVVVKWFRTVEKPKGVGLEPDGTISEWMHGIISRADADELLRDKPLGSFLIRVSVKIWGYTVSIKCRLGIQHFMIDTSKGHYQFSGKNMNEFSSLKKLLDHHLTDPLTQQGDELLVLPCGQASMDSPDYQELYEAGTDDSDEEDSMGTDL